MTVRSGRVEEQHARQRLPLGTASPGAARRFTGSTLSTWGLDAHGDVAELLVSELVTNAIHHGRTTCLLELTATPTVLRAAVADDGEGSPGCAMPDPRTRAGAAWPSWTRSPRGGASSPRRRARSSGSRSTSMLCRVLGDGAWQDAVIDPALTLSIELVEDGDERVVVRVGGEIDTATGEALQTRAPCDRAASAAAPRSRPLRRRLPRLVRAAGPPRRPAGGGIGRAAGARRRLHADDRPAPRDHRPRGPLPPRRRLSGVGRQPDGVDIRRHEERSTPTWPVMEMRRLR